MKGRKAKARLERRREDYDKGKLKREDGYTRPGSSKKSFPGASKGRRR